MYSDKKWWPKIQSVERKIWSLCTWTKEEEQKGLSQIINLLPFSTKFILFCLLCENESWPFKCDFSLPAAMMFCQSRVMKGHCRRKKFASWFGWAPLQPSYSTAGSFSSITFVQSTVSPWPCSFNSQHLTPLKANNFCQQPHQTVL